MEIQDNVSKAREIGLAIGKGVVDVIIATAGAAEMAEWKDQQFKEYLEKKKLACVMNAKQVFGYDMGGAYDLELKAHFCDEIINELFPNDKEQN